MLLKVLVTFIIYGICNSTSIHEISNNEGNQNQNQWLIIFAVAPIGLLTNSIALHLYYANPFFYKPGQRIRASYGLNIVCVLFFLHQIIKTSINYSHQSFYNKDIQCTFDTAINVALFEWIFMVIVFMSENVKNEFVLPRQKNRDIYMKVMLCGLYSTLIGILCVVLPGSSYSLDQTGTYCFLDFNSINSVIIFIVFGIIFPLLYLINNLIKANHGIKIAQQMLIDEGSNARAKILQVMAVKIVIISTLIFPFIESPNIIGALYQWISGQYPPIYFDIIGTNTHLFYLCIFPLQSLVLYELRITFWRLYCLKIQSFYYILTNKRSKISGIINKINTNELQFEDWTFWLNNTKNNSNNYNNENKQLKDIFIKYAENRYVVENLLYYLDVLKYNELCNQLLILLQTNNQSNNKSQKSIKISNIRSEKSYELISHLITIKEIELYKQIYMQANHIYKLYIKTPTAPLEINISDQERINIYKILHINNNSHNNNEKNELIKNNNLNEIPLFPEIIDMESNEVLRLLEEYSVVFDDTILTISKIIETDIFPRFQASKIFHQTIKNYLANIDTIEEV